MFMKIGIEKFFWVGYVVQIEVDDCYYVVCEGNFIRFCQCVGWVFDLFLVVCCMQQGVCECGFVGFEVVVQVDCQVWCQYLGQVGIQVGSGGFVGQVEVELLYVYVVLGYLGWFVIRFQFEGLSVYVYLFYVC